ncbi:MAG: hypothetical protein ACRC9L_05425 [Brevinema sp.]
MKKKTTTFGQMKTELEQIAEALEDSALSYDQMKDLAEQGEEIASQLSSALSRDLVSVSEKLKKR